MKYLLLILFLISQISLAENVRVGKDGKVYVKKVDGSELGVKPLESNNKDLTVDGVLKTDAISQIGSQIGITGNLNLLSDNVDVIFNRAGSQIWKIEPSSAGSGYDKSLQFWNETPLVTFKLSQNGNAYFGGSIGAGTVPNYALDISGASNNTTVAQFSTGDDARKLQLTPYNQDKGGSIPNAHWEWYNTSSVGGFSFATAAGTRMTIDSTGLATFNNGISFGQSTLDHYEEASGVITIPAGIGYTIDTTYDDWMAIRVGRIVTIRFRLKFDYGGTITDSTPDFIFNGLPASMYSSGSDGTMVSFFSTDTGGSLAQYQPGFLRNNNTLMLYKTIPLTGYTGSGTVITGYSPANYWVSVTYLVN